MTDLGHLERRVEAARELLVPQLHPADTERALRKFKDLGKRRRRRAVIGGVLATSCAAAAAAVFFLDSAPFSQAPVPGVAAETPPTTPPKVEKKIVQFADGSHAELLKEKTELRVDKTSIELLELTLVSGAARIEVVPNPNRLFRVSTKHLRIEVLGTAFTVYQEAGDESVTVHRGRVAVFAGKDRYELVQGMTYRYDETLEVASAKPRIKKRSRARGKNEAAPAWRALAEDGKMSEAYDAMRTPDATDVHELMLAADVARLTGHPKEAAQFLETAVEKNRSDPNAVLAAFTLGRIYERELKEPKRCADAYRIARELAPRGSLAEDALVHEIECRERAGDAAASKALAKEYLDRYPEGRKAEQMKSISGSD